jgi:hypothetical protein
MTNAEQRVAADVAPLALRNAAEPERYVPMKNVMSSTKIPTSSRSWLRA